MFLGRISIRSTLNAAIVRMRIVAIELEFWREDAGSPTRGLPGFCFSGLQCGLPCSKIGFTRVKVHQPSLDTEILMRAQRKHVDPQRVPLRSMRDCQQSSDSLVCYSMR